MHPRVKTIIHNILGHEGKFVDDPDDPGGATNYGVSLRYAKGIGLDNDGDGDTDIDDIRLVTYEQAFALFLEDFYQDTGIWQLPDELQPLATDFAVHSGAQSIITLQRTLNRARKTAPRVLSYAPLNPDGIMGPKTRRAAEIAYHEMGPYLVNAFAEARLDFLWGLAEDDPKFLKYLKARDGGKGGWVKRVESFYVEPCEKAA